MTLSDRRNYRGWTWGSVLIVEDIAGNARLAPEPKRCGSFDPEYPDLVLIDVMIPRVNGLDACREITHGPNTRLSPAVLIRSLNDSASRIVGMDVGR